MYNCRVPTSSSKLRMHRIRHGRQPTNYLFRAALSSASTTDRALSTVSKLIRRVWVFDTFKTRESSSKVGAAQGGIVSTERWRKLVYSRTADMRVSVF